MAQIIKGGLMPYLPYSILRVAYNKLLMANGIDLMLKWDGQSSNILGAGVTAPTTASTLADGGAGSLIAGTYYGYVRFVDAEGNPSNPSPVSAGLALGASKQISWTNIPVTSDSQVVKKQLLRNTAGQAGTFYVVHEMTGAALSGTTTYTDNVTDATLFTKEAVVLTDSEGVSQVTRWTMPPRHKAVLAQHLGRVFAAVEIELSKGHAEVTNGSTVVNIWGQPIPWTMAASRQLYVPGYPAADIAAVSTFTQIFLSNPWGGTTNKFTNYAIRSVPAYQRTVHWSDTEFLEGWSPLNAVSVPETGGEITGLASMGSYLYVIEDRAIHRFSFQSDPASGTLYIATYRGCVNNRCWVVLDESIMLLLDRKGIYAFDGGSSAEPISQAIQEVFRDSESPYRINWNHTTYWHAVHYHDQETVRWFVTMGGGKRPRHALCYHYRLKRWWIEEYAIPIMSGCAATRGLPQVFLGGRSNVVWGISFDSIDGLDAGDGVSGSVVAAGKYDLTAALDFPSEVQSCPIYIVDGTGKGGWNIITAVSGKTLTVKYPWRMRLDTTSRFSVGAIPWQWEGGRYRWVDSEQNARREIHFFHEPLSDEVGAEVAVRSDFSDQAEIIYDSEFPAEPKEFFHADLRKTEGYQLLRIDDSRAQRTDGPRIVQVGIKGFRTREHVRIYAVEIDGAV